MPCNAQCSKPTKTQAHCGACHVTFTGVNTFDVHRNGGVCATPQSMGFIEVDGLWTTPEGHANRAVHTARFKAMLKETS